MARRLAVILGLASMVAVGAALGAAFGVDPALSSATTVKVIEHAKSDTVVDVGRRGDSEGDLLTFHNPVFNETNARKVGSDQGACIRIDPDKGTWECAWTTLLADGGISVEGPFYDNRESSRLSVTGGTGIYRNARGTMEIHPRRAGTEYAFIFHLMP